MQMAHPIDPSTGVADMPTTSKAHFFIASRQELIAARRKYAAEGTRINS
jgi:hypothetical protein